MESNYKKLKRALLLKKKFWLEQLRERYLGSNREETKEIIKETAVETAKLILALAAVSGFLMVAVMAPNLVSVLGGLKRRPYQFDQKKFKKSLNYLRDKKLATYKQQDGVYRLKPTSRGVERALFLAYQDLKLEKPAEWDRLWRVVIFDVPNQRTRARDFFRRKLKEMGFYQIQRSILVTPHPCAKEVIILAEMLGISDCLRLMEVKFISPNLDLRKNFRL